MTDKFKQWRAGIRAATLPELIDELTRQNPDNYGHRAVMAEITRVQTEALLASSRAQIDAAEAAKETARYTKDVARYMFWSVLAVAASAVIALLSVAVTVWL